VARFSLDDARAAAADGRPDAAIDLAWRAVRPAVLAQDDAFIREAMTFAETLAAETDGPARQEAEQLAAYCTACILQPRDTQPSPWSMKRLLAFRSSETKACPDCAEKIKVDARVCRFCGYRYPTPT